MIHSKRYGKNSFALLTFEIPMAFLFYRELAELLGQVKPPTTSKEELEKSGLEIIKPSDLEAYEKEGKISSNCIERVICEHLY